MADLLVADINAGFPVSLGFEAPLFVPLPDQPSYLNRQRVGERGRPWCAGAGTGALAMGAQQASWLLRAIAGRLRLKPHVAYTLEEFEAKGGLLIWEAFVSGAGKNRNAAEPHVDDARRAVAEFLVRSEEGDLRSDITEQSVINLGGAAVLAAGLSDDLTLLTTPCSVIRVPDFAPSAMDAPNAGAM